MSGDSQKKAIDNYRSRLAERGIARFEVQALAIDRDLIREVARKMTAGGSEVPEFRAALRQALKGESPKKGGILKALRNSPLVGADLDLTRSKETGRTIDL